MEASAIIECGILFYQQNYFRIPFITKVNSKIENDCFFFVLINTKFLERIHSTTGHSEAEENLETDNKLFTDLT